jgi:hypothetical protein
VFVAEFRFIYFIFVNCIDIYIHRIPVHVGSLVQGQEKGFFSIARHRVFFEFLTVWYCFHSIFGRTDPIFACEQFLRSVDTVHSFSVSTSTVLFANGNRLTVPPYYFGTAGVFPTASGTTPRDSVESITRAW